MSEPKRRVVVVRGGTWGSTTPEEQDMYLRAILETLERTIKEESGQDEPWAVIEVTENVTDAKNRIRAGNVRVLVFGSRGQEETARTFKTEFPHVRVIVLSALPPNDQAIIWLNKTLRPATIADLILHG